MWKPAEYGYSSLISFFTIIARILSDGWFSCFSKMIACLKIQLITDTKIIANTKKNAPFEITSGFVIKVQDN